jgi:hypothetical protein
MLVQVSTLARHRHRFQKMPENLFPESLLLLLVSGSEGHETPSGERDPNNQAGGERKVVGRVEHQLPIQRNALLLIGIRK